MKKIILILLVLLYLTPEAKCQTEYDTCQYINQFAGEWMYASGNDTIRIYLKADRSYYSDFNKIEDRLYGWHEYKQGNTVIETMYPYRFMTTIDVDTITSNSFSIGLRMGSDMDCSALPRKAGGTITDYLQAREGKSVTVTLDPTGTIMNWKQRHFAGYGLFTGAWGMTLPKEFVLIKQ